MWALPVSSRARGQATDDWGSRWRSRAPYTSRWAVEDLSDSVRDCMEAQLRHPDDPPGRVPSVMGRASSESGASPLLLHGPSPPGILITNARPFSSGHGKALPGSSPRWMTPRPPVASTTAGVARRVAARQISQPTHPLPTLSGFGSFSGRNLVMDASRSDRYLGMSRKPSRISISILRSPSISGFDPLSGGLLPIPRPASATIPRLRSSPIPPLPGWGGPRRQET